MLALTCLAATIDYEINEVVIRKFRGKRPYWIYEGRFVITDVNQSDANTIHVRFDPNDPNLYVSFSGVINPFGGVIDPNNLKEIILIDVEKKKARLQKRLAPKIVKKPETIIIKGDKFVEELSK